MGPGDWNTNDYDMGPRYLTENYFLIVNYLKNMEIKGDESEVYGDVNLKKFLGRKCSS